jgi:hypothetical protein
MGPKKMRCSFRYIILIHWVKMLSVFNLYDNRYHLAAVTAYHAVW